MNLVEALEAYELCPVMSKVIIDDFIRDNQRFIHKIVNEQVVHNPYKSATYDDIFQIVCLKIYDMFDYAVENKGHVDNVVAWFKNGLLFQVREQIHNDYAPVKVPYSTQKYAVRNDDKSLNFYATMSSTSLFDENPNSDDEVRKTPDALIFGESPETKIEKESLLALLEMAKQTLSNEERLIITAYFGDDELTFRDLAEALGESKSSINNKYNAALNKMRKYMGIEKCKNRGVEGRYAFSA